MRQNIIHSIDGQNHICIGTIVYCLVKHHINQLSFKIGNVLLVLKLLHITNGELRHEEIFVWKFWLTADLLRENYFSRFLKEGHFQLFLVACPNHVVTFNLISNLVTDYIQKRRGQALLFSFEYNLLPSLISK